MLFENRLAIPTELQGLFFNKERFSAFSLVNVSRLPRNARSRDMLIFFLFFNQLNYIKEELKRVQPITNLRLLDNTKRPKEKSIADRGSHKTDLQNLSFSRFLEREIWKKEIA